jgi:hypothetical protein
MFGRVVPFACALSLSSAAALWSTAAHAQTEMSVHAMFSEGLSIESSGVHHLHGGGLISFGRIAVDAGVGGTVWNRWQDPKGTSATAIEIGANVRVDITGRGKARGPYAGAGAAYARLLDGAEKELDFSGSDDRAAIGPNGFVGRAFVGYGFPTTKTITIAVTLAVSYWRYEAEAYLPEFPDPHPNPLVFQLGLEFMRWR